MTLETNKSPLISDRASLRASVLCWMLVFGLLPLGVGCQNSEAPPPLPSPKPAETTPTIQLPVEEEEEEEEEEEAPKKGGVARGPLTACCGALRQNAASAPQPTKGYLETAANACDSANKNSSAKIFLAGLGTMLKGAGVPASCK